MWFFKKKHSKGFDDTKNNNNILWIQDNGTELHNPVIPGLEVKFSGKNNTCRVYGSKTIFTNSIIIFAGNDSTFSIDSQTREILPSGIGINRLVVYISRGANVKIGKDFSCGGCNIIADNLGADIEIGNDLMLSSDTVIRSTDGHTITKNEKKINPGKPIKIGNHCWLGMRSCILKGVHLPDNCIVSFGAIVLSNLKARQGDIIAGIPAKVIKSGINWTRDNYDDYQ